jgi:erythromycin esterase-like protein
MPDRYDDRTLEEVREDFARHTTGWAPVIHRLLATVDALRAEVAAERERCAKAWTTPCDYCQGTGLDGEYACQACDRLEDDEIRALDLDPKEGGSDAG